VTFELLFTAQADADLDLLEAGAGLAKQLRFVRKALGLLETNPRHPGLNTHKFRSKAPSSIRKLSGLEFGGSWTLISTA